MAMTSPPYWGLRDYGVEGQLGLEETPHEFVEKLVSIFDELQRVLKPTGTFFLNLDDKYESQKSLVGVPERVALAMIESGWILRNKIIWSKPNPMPESVKDRLAGTWEYVYMFSLEKQYYFDLDSIREPHKESSKQRFEYSMENSGTPGEAYPDEEREKPQNWAKGNPMGKNPGDVWEIATYGFSDAHFAVYPEELCERPIQAGCPKKVCAECGTPYSRETDVEYEQSPQHGDGSIVGRRDEGDRLTQYDGMERKQAIYRPGPLKQECDCDTEEWRKGVALDPFAGAGTTLLAARRRNRDYIGIELNAEYAEMAENRIMDEMGGEPLDQFVKN